MNSRWPKPATNAVDNRLIGERDQHRCREELAVGFNANRGHHDGTPRGQVAFPHELNRLVQRVEPQQIEQAAQQPPSVFKLLWE